MEATRAIGEGLTFEKVCSMIQARQCAHKETPRQIEAAGRRIG
jgi:hypothetical protein